jgi:hypothetical protein
MQTRLMTNCRNCVGTDGKQLNLRYLPELLFKVDGKNGIIKPHTITQYPFYNLYLQEIFNHGRVH